MNHARLNIFALNTLKFKMSHVCMCVSEVHSILTLLESVYYPSMKLKPLACIFCFTDGLYMMFYFLRIKIIQLKLWEPLFKVIFLNDPHTTQLTIQ